MMGHYPAWDFKLAASGEVACRGLEKEERLFWPSVVELLDVLRVVPANSNDLGSK
jgi:hypothetical protein